MLDMFFQEWTADIRDKERYEMYRSFRVMFGAEKYLSVIDIYCFRVALTQLRLGVLPINSNMYRYSGCPTKKERKKEKKEEKKKKKKKRVYFAKTKLKMKITSFWFVLCTRI